MKGKTELLRPETNNLRRIFIEREYASLKAMADDLGENPIGFRKYFRVTKPVIPQIEKLQRWSRTLNIELAEFFYISEPVKWPRPKKEHVTVHKKGLCYRDKIRLRESIKQMVAEERWDTDEISWFLMEDQ